MIYPTKKLGETIDFMPKSKRRAGDGLDEGKYLFFSSSQNRTKYLNEVDYKYEAIILGTGGTASLHIAKNFSTSADVFIIRSSDVNILENRYLYLFLMANMSVLNQGFKGAALKHLSKGYLKEIEISLPPVGEQKKIVARLEGLLGKIKEAKRLRAEAQEAAQNLFPAELHKIFEEGKKKGWEEKTISDICNVQSGGTPRKGVDEYWTNGNIPWLRSEACRDGKVDNAILFITNDGMEHSSAKLLKPRTTLIALVGATIGKTGFLTFESTTNQNIAGLYPKNDQELLPEFLFIIARNLYSHFLNIGQGKFKMANLAFVKSLIIPLPPVAEQKKIVTRLDGLSEKIKKLQEYQRGTKSDMESLEQSVLHQAFASK